MSDENDKRPALLIDLSCVGWGTLRTQKQALLAIIDSNLRLADKSMEHGAACKEEARHMQGILHLLDHIQDEAAKVIGDEIVFGFGPAAGKL